MLNVNSRDDENNYNADEEDYPGDQFGGDLNVCPWDFEQASNPKS